MSGAIVRRFVSGVGLLWLVLTITYVLVELAPGDPSRSAVDGGVPLERRQALRQAWGLDGTPSVRYLSWLRSTLAGDWGTSFRLHEPVNHIVARALPLTVVLTGTALLIQFIVGVGGGILAARRRGWVDRLVRLSTQILYSLPLFWLCLMGILVFSLRLGWLPPGGAGSTFDKSGLARFGDLLQHLILPAVALGVGSAGPVLRLTRNAVLDALTSDFVRAARARGAGRGRILWLHALPHAAPALIQSFGVSFPLLLSGSLVTEVAFGWPGLGRVAWDAVLARDAPVVLATTALGAVAVVVGLVLADLLQALIDPRLRDG